MWIPFELQHLLTVFFAAVSVGEFWWKCKEKYVCIITYSIHYCCLTLTKTRKCWQNFCKSLWYTILLKFF